jgi:hypothetical protein
MDFKETGCENIGWIQDIFQLAAFCEYDNEPSGSIKDGNFIDELS